VSRSSKFPGVDAAYINGNSYVPENELMRAIILRVIEDLKKGGELRDDAIEFLYDEDEEYVFSFRAICSHLGFDAVKTRDCIIDAIDSGRRISTRRRAA